jgi:hypothetical protein
MQITQLMSLKVRLCDLELLCIKEKDLGKRRYIFKKKQQLKKERRNYHTKALIDRKVLSQMDSGTLETRWLHLYFDLTNEIRQLYELSLVKYNMRLHNRKEEDVKVARK